jgi:hypothetical protein
MLRRVLLAAALTAVLATGGNLGTAAQAVPRNESPTASTAYVESPECLYQGPHSVVGRGTTGPVVAHLQCLLNRIWGYDVPIDGIAGPATGRAVISHQADCHIPVDGIVGLQTWIVLHPATASPECLDEGRD